MICVLSLLTWKAVLVCCADPTLPPPPLPKPVILSLHPSLWPLTSPFTTNHVTNLTFQRQCQQADDSLLLILSSCTVLPCENEKSAWSPVILKQGFWEKMWWEGHHILHWKWKVDLVLSLEGPVALFAVPTCEAFFPSLHLIRTMTQNKLKRAKRMTTN